jgi:predicted DNA-binding transcriptional regulator AlpA
MAFDDTTTGEPAADEPFLVDEDVMERLHIGSKMTLYRYIRDGLPCHRVRPNSPRLYIWSEVSAWVKSRCTAPAPDRGAA